MKGIWRPLENGRALLVHFYAQSTQHHIIKITITCTCTLLCVHEQPSKSNTVMIHGIWIETGKENLLCPNSASGLSTNQFHGLMLGSLGASSYNLDGQDGRPYLQPFPKVSN